MERRNFQGANRKHNSDLSVCHTAHTHTHTHLDTQSKKKKKKLGRKNKSHCQVGKVGQWFVRGRTGEFTICFSLLSCTTVHNKQSLHDKNRERERTQRERGREMETWREECWEDELIQAEACWHVRSLCTVFCVCFYLQQTERAYEKCAVGLTHRVSECAGKKLKILLFF